MKRWQAIAIVVIAVLAIGVLVGYHVGVRLLQDKVVAALGPGSRLTELKVNWFSIELLGLSIDGPKGWPAARTFEAERVTIVPDLRTLFTDKIGIASIVVEKPYLSVLRLPGKVLMVPSLMERNGNRTNGESSQAGARAVMISTIKLKDGSLDFYDATVSPPLLKTRIEEIEAVIREVAAPASEKTYFDLDGIVKGVKRDGRAKVSGWVGPVVARCAGSGGLGRAPTLSCEKNGRQNRQRDTRLKSCLRSSRQQSRWQRQSDSQRFGVCAVVGVFRYFHGSSAQRGHQFS
jgi:hypothetical protein